MTVISSKSQLKKKAPVEQGGKKKKKAAATVKDNENESQEKKEKLQKENMNNEEDVTKLKDVSKSRVKTKKQSRKRKKQLEARKKKLAAQLFKSETYDPCVHLHFKPEHIDRDCLTHDQYLEMLATPKGYRWAGEVDCTNPELEINKRRKKKMKRKRIFVEHPEAGDGEEEVETIWDVITPEITGQLIDFLVNEFGMSHEEAEDFICCITQTCDVKQPVSKKKKTKQNASKYKWAKDYSQAISEKLEQYINVMLSKKRTPRVRKIAEVIIERVCDLTGENISMDRPKKKSHKIMVHIADRLALWIDDIYKAERKRKVPAEEEIPESELEEEEEEVEEEQEGEKKEDKGEEGEEKDEGEEEEEEGAEEEEKEPEKEEEKEPEPQKEETKEPEKVEEKQPEKEEAKEPEKQEEKEPEKEEKPPEKEKEPEKEEQPEEEEKPKEEEKEEVQEEKPKEPEETTEEEKPKEEGEVGEEGEEEEAEEGDEEEEGEEEEGEEEEGTEEKIGEAEEEEVIEEVPAEEEKPEEIKPKEPRRPVLPPKRGPGFAFEVKPKTGSTLHVQKLSSGTVVEITAKVRGVEAPPRGRKVPVSESPLNLKSAEDWAEWAENIGNMADEWGKWLENRLTDAEKQLLEKRRSKETWKAWKEQAHTEALKWRVEEERIKDEAEMWGRKIDEKDKNKSETEIRTTDLS